MTIEDTTPWILLIALGAMHGLNPCMGWMFATSIGWRRQSRVAVLTSLLPIGLGHVLSVLAVAVLVVSFSVVVDPRWVEIIGGAALITLALYHSMLGRMITARLSGAGEMAGLGAWSFLMATGHGAGLMLVPVMIPLCLAGTPARELVAGGSLTVALGAIGVHMMALLSAAALIALAAYDGLSSGRFRNWRPYLDQIWSAVLCAGGVYLLV